MDIEQLKTLTYEYKKGETVIKRTLAEVVSTKDVWETKDRIKVISLAGIQKISEKEGIVEKKFETSIQPTEGNKQQHGVNIWVGFKGDLDHDNWRRGSGEASMLNTGKIVADKDGSRRYEEYAYIDSKYRYAMADKRAFCRAVLKLIQLYGVYSEVEAKEFAQVVPSTTISGMVTPDMLLHNYDL